MDFIQTSNKQLDKFGPGKHGFAPGNPGLGVLATYLSNLWCDAVQQELMNIVEGGGLVANAGSQSQMLQALRRLYGGNFRVVTAVGATNLNFDDAGLVLINATAGNVTVNLPAAGTILGLPITLRRVDASANTVTVNANGADIFDIGLATSFTMAPAEVVKMRSNGISAWIVELVQRMRSARLTASGSIVVPWYVNLIYASGIGAAGGGGAGGGNSGGQPSFGVGGGGGGGGGAGQVAYRQPLVVTPNATIAAVIGTGGNGGAVGGGGGAGGTGGVGTATTIAALGFSLAGGSPGTGGSQPASDAINGGGGGGSGGAGGPDSARGSNGGDGNNAGNGGAGASSPYGGGGGAGSARTTGGLPGGDAAKNSGAGGGGGGGGYIKANSLVPGGAGGKGADGVLHVEW